MDFPVRVETVTLQNADLALVGFARVNCASAAVERVVEMCGDTAANDAALAAWASRNTEAQLSGETAVYVVRCESDRASKIGITQKPLGRLSALQTGSPERLSFSHLFWMPHQVALHVEGVILALAEYQKHRASGEWTTLPCAELAETIAWALLLGEGVSFSDSRMLCQNLRNIRNADEKADPHATRGIARFLPEDAILARLDEQKSGC